MLTVWLAFGMGISSSPVCRLAFVVVLLRLSPLSKIDKLYEYFGKLHRSSKSLWKYPKKEAYKLHFPIIKMKPLSSY